MTGSLDKPDPAIGYQFPSGHLGHLSPTQQTAFEAFKQLCADRGVYTPGKGDQLPSIPDHTLLRFLRARKFDPNGAFDQSTASDKWMKQNRSDELYDAIDIEEYDTARKLYPQWIGTRDKRGMPVYSYEVGPLDTKSVQAQEKMNQVKGVDMDGRTEPAKMLRVIALYENLTRFVTPWCSASPNRPHLPAPITQGCNIIDIKGTGLKQFWDLKNHLQDSSQLATAYYPETLDRIFIIGAPSFFPTVWSWVKRWFDPVVVSKMFISSNSEVLKVLSEHIDPDNIPKKYGGNHDYSFGDSPNLHPQSGVLEGWTWEDGHTALPIGPMRWVEGEDGEMVALAVGSHEGEKRQRVVGRSNRKWKETVYPQVPSHSDVRKDTAENGMNENGENGEVVGIPTSAGPPKTEQQVALET